MVNAELPAGWKWKELEEVCVHPQYGWTTSGSAEGKLHLLRTTDITSGNIDWETVPFCAEEPPDKEKYLLHDGDIVISRAGSVGFSHLIKNPKPAVFASYLIRFRPLINEKYVAFFLQSPSYWQAISEQSLGIAIPNVNASKLKKIQIPIAPDNEQERIVAKIEELFTQLEAGTFALERVQAGLRRYKTSVLKAAVDGKLVEQYVNDKPASELLNGILATRKKPATPPDTSELGKLPRGWVWATAEQLSEAERSITYGVVKLGEEVDNGIPTLRSSNVRHLHIETDVIKRISPEIANQYKRTKLQGGEVLITVRGTLGGVAVVPDELAGCNISREVAMIALIDKRIASIVQYFIASKPLQIWLTKRTRGIAYTGVNIETLKELPIPLPPLEEQRRIVAEVERRLSVARQVETAVEAALVRASRLRQAVLKSAFEGRLT